MSIPVAPDARVSDLTVEQLSSVIVSAICEADAKIKHDADAPRREAQAIVDRLVKGLSDLVDEAREKTGNPDVYVAIKPEAIVIPNKLRRGIATIPGC